MRRGDARLAWPAKPRMAGLAPQQGYALLLMMIVVAVLFASSLTLVTRWSDDMRREREQDLMRAGDEIAAAITSYHQGAGGTKRYPPTLEDLLLDRRAFGLVRHLRRIPLDPITRTPGWGLVRATDGGIMGVYSTSSETPMREVPAVLEHVQLPAARRYSEWKFIAQVSQ